MSLAIACRAAIGVFALNLPLFPAEAGTIVAQWNMDNTFGTVMEDSSGNGNDGTTYDVVTSGSGYIFNGISSKVVVPDSPTLNPGTKSFSYSAQVQTDRRPAQGQTFEILRKGTSIRTGGEYKLELGLHSGKAKAYCEMKDSLGNVSAVRGSTDIADGKLHTITCTKTSTGLTLQVDNLKPRRTTAVLKGPIDNPKPFTVGVKQSLMTSTPEDFFYGTIRSATVTVGD